MTLRCQTLAQFELRYSSQYRRYYLVTPAKSSQDSIYGHLSREQIANEYSVENIVETPSPCAKRANSQVASLVSNHPTDFI
jgi:UTP-glucose-1-phosphate uridylyltransferase